MNTKNLVRESRNLYHKIFRLLELECIGINESVRTQKIRSAFIHAHARFRRRQSANITGKGVHYAKSI